MSKAASNASKDVSAMASEKPARSGSTKKSASSAKKAATKKSPTKKVSAKAVTKTKDSVHALENAAKLLSTDGQLEVLETDDKGKKKYTLVVVESPTKAKTLKKYLGPGYEVLASKGHVKDLPKKMGIDIAHDFQETYQVIEGKEKIVNELKSAASKASSILLATDPDREGEAIAVHISEELKSLAKPMQRVLFHEITKRGVTDGITHPRALDMNLYEAQRTRRVLDRIVGYDVSALVWTKVAFGLSAGRVQSVALRLIVDREHEIDAFQAEEYWNIGVGLLGTQKPGFVAKLLTASGEKVTVSHGDAAAKVKADLESADYKVKTVTKKEQRRHAPAPYTTSKLQQDATNYLHFSAKRAMQIAQALYEGVDLGKDGGPVGLITYMRTDSVRVSEDAIQAVREYIETTYGKAAMPEKPNYFKSKKSAQDAHEAIRPSSLDLPPALVQPHLKDEQFKLYKLIWDRFVASQMAPAVYDQTTVDIEAGVKRPDALHKEYGLRVTGRVLKTSGWLEQYGKGLDSKTHLAGEDDDAEENKTAENTEEADGSLPVLNENESLSRVDPPGVLAEQKFTLPPPRFNEGSLVRELEKRGIGRPSTYAEIISKVQARDYVEKLQGGAFKPTELGRVVVEGLVKSSLDFIDPGFTAKMEEELDEVEEGRLGRVELLKSFYTKFHRQLEAQKKGKRWNPEPIDLGEACPNCTDGALQKRWSRNGWFIGCSKYPTCKFTRSLNAAGEEAPVRPTVFGCEKCGTGLLLFREGRNGAFLGCSNYPTCDMSRPVPLMISCPQCNKGEIMEKSFKKGGRKFWGCSNYAATEPCDYRVFQRPVRETCPNCSGAFLLVSASKKDPALSCPVEGCGYSKKISHEEAEKYVHLIPQEIFAPAGTPIPARSTEPAPKKAKKKPAKKAAKPKGGTAQPEA